jgi:hypothetical protein
MQNISVLKQLYDCAWALPARRLMPHTFCFGSVENTLQARRKQIPALKARNSKARGETPGLDGFGTSPARAAQLLCRSCRAKPTFCPRAQGSRARCRVLFHPGLCCAAPAALAVRFAAPRTGLPRKQKVCDIRRDAGAPGFAGILRRTPRLQD